MPLTPPEAPLVKQVMTSLAALVAAIDSATPDPDDPSKALYFHKANAVIRPPYISDEWLDGSRDLTYMLLPGKDTPAEDTVNQYTRTLEVWVLGALRWTDPEQNPYLEGGKRIDAADELAHDVGRAILHDWELAGLVENTELIDIERGWLTTGYVTITMMFQVLFSHQAEDL